MVTRKNDLIRKRAVASVFVALLMFGALVGPNAIADGGGTPEPPASSDSTSYLATNPDGTSSSSESESSSTDMPDYWWILELVL